MNGSSLLVVDLCSSLTKAGSPCKRSRMEGSEFCVVHTPGRQCAQKGCGGTPKAGEEYCYGHKDRDAQRLRQLQARLEKLEARQRRQPPVRFVEEGWLDKSVREAAEYFEVGENHIYRWRSEVEYQKALAKVREFRREKPSVFTGIEDLPKSHFDWTVDHIEILLDGFVEFRRKYFKTPQREPYGTPAFQRKWAKHMLLAKVTGGRECIMAPVRHGKSKLFEHLCIFLWMLDPNLRVMWVSVTSSIAEKPGAQMRMEFMSNRRLIEDYAVGGTFEPAVRDPRRWTNGEFTLATRTDYDINGANFIALGAGSSIISLNADIIVVDDIEDQKSVAQLGTRDKTKEWWITQLGSRKEEHTGLFVIGSRQHPDDLHSVLLNDPSWHVIVEQAHDPTCAIEGDEGHWDCLLFPEVRTWKWLMEQKREADKISPAYFELTYQNVSRVDGLVVFAEEDVKACRSPLHQVGVVPKAKSGEGAVSLVAGLDPAISGFQAAVLLAYQTSPELRIWLVDLDNTSGGGVAAAASLIRKWYEQYGVTSWVAESNLLGNMSDYTEIKDYTSKHGIWVQNWRTGSNKNSQFFGVTSLAALFRDRNIVLPYGDGPSRETSDKLVRQLVVWDEGNSRNKNRTGVHDDLVMALWFAWDPIRRARQDWNDELEFESGAYGSFGLSDSPWLSLDEPAWA